MNVEEIFILILLFVAFVLSGLIFLVQLCVNHVYDYAKAVADDHETRIKKLEGKDDTKKEAR